MAIVNTLLLYISCFDEVSVNLEAINGSYIVYNLFIGYLFFLIHMAEIGVRLVFYYFKNAIRRLLQRIELQFISNEINDEKQIEKPYGQLNWITTSWSNCTIPCGGFGFKVIY